MLKRIEKAAVLRLLAPAYKDIILDAGCGAGYYLHALLEQGLRAEGLDFSKEMVERARRFGFCVNVANLEQNMNVFQKYDKIICAGVMEFCQNDTAALKNLKNILKPSGIIVLLVPNLSFCGRLYELFHRYFGCGRKINLYNVDKIAKLADLCNLKIRDMAMPLPHSLVVKLGDAG